MKMKKITFEKIAISTKTEGDTGGILIPMEMEMMTLILRTFCKTILIFTKYFEKIIFSVSNREEDEDENEENDNRKNSNIEENGRGDRGHTNSNGNGNDDRHRRSDRRKRSDNHNKVMAPPSNGGTGMYLDSN